MEERAVNYQPGYELWTQVSQIVSLSDPQSWGHLKNPKKIQRPREWEAISQGRNDQSLYLLSLFLLPPWWGSKSELASGERKKKSYHPPLLQRQMVNTYRPQCGLGGQTLLLSKTWRIWLISWTEYVLITESRLCFVTLSDFRTVYSWRNEQKSHRPCPSFHPRSEKFYTKGVYFIGHWETK